MNRRMKLIFTISLLLNIVFVGIAAGMYVRMKGDIPMPRDITPEARQFLSSTFEKGRAEVKPLIGIAKEKRKAVESVITAENFDRAAYDAAVKDMIDARDTIARKKADIMGRALVDLSADERQKFAGFILDGLEGRKGGKGRHHHDTPKDGERPPEPR